jgi:hypothetical protein
MSLATAQDFIYHAFRTCGQMRSGYTLPPELLTDGLDQWQSLFDGYNARRTMQYTEPDFVFPVTGPGHGTTGNGQTFGGTGYQIGPTALDFVAPRPAAIARANLYLTSASPATPTRIPLTPVSMQEWMNIPVLNLNPVNVPTTFAYDPQYPNGVIWIWPPQRGNSLELFTWGQLAPPVNLSDPFSAPPGYSDLIMYQLAMRLWPYCTKDIMPARRKFEWVAGMAERTRQTVAALNAPSPRLRNDFGGGSRGTSGVSSWTQILTGVPY